MTNEEAIKTIQIAIDEVEWNYPINYVEAFEMAIEALKNKDKHEAAEQALKEREKNG
ncbi:MAG: hypothetical protein Q4B62_05435 [Clostridiaceae bacterium]|nr:hypothetical protein [Clostridiaceae bacterium]